MRQRSRWRLLLETTIQKEFYEPNYCKAIFDKTIEYRAKNVALLLVETRSLGFEIFLSIWKTVENVIL